MSRIKNAMTIDVEDWFCTYNVRRTMGKKKWKKCQLRLQAPIHDLLNLFEKHSVKATFFILGYIAEKAPHLVLEIEKKGHEIATHGYSHEPISNMKPEDFKKDLLMSLKAIDKCGVKNAPLGYRAPSFSITPKTEWTLAILKETGLQYDSSIFPVSFHPDYGNENYSLGPQKMPSGLWEFPISCITISGFNVPCGGGAYFRFLPYWYVKKAINKCNNSSRPCIFYLHPWELDPGQPRLEMPLLRYLRQYYGLDGCQKKLEKLIKDFQFTTVKEVLGL